MHSIEKLYERFLETRTVCTDSRTIVPGAIFFALKGERFDGNRYVDIALKKGASLCVIDNPEYARGEATWVVDDVLKTLQQLARHHRRRLNIPVLAITGSNGKTTTKELVSRVLARRYRVSVTQGNLNNHIGVPLTLLAIPEEAEMAVVEMGANHQGEIASYCAIAEPDFGLITNIGKAHLGEFGGESGIRKGKGELFAYLAQHGGKAFVPTDDPVLTGMAGEYKGLTNIEFKQQHYSIMAEDGPFLSVNYEGEAIHTRMTGSYNAANAASAIAVGEYFQIPRPDIVRAIESYIPDNARSQHVDTGTNIVILDAYNANPSSMTAALEHFLSHPEPGREAVVMLGDMFELGDYAAEEHRRIVERLLMSGLSKVYLVGRYFSKAATGTPFQVFDDVKQLVKYLGSQRITESRVLIKGSRGMKLEEVLSVL